MDGNQAQADCITVMEIIRPLLLSPHSDQLAQDIAAAIEAVCQMAKSDKLRQHALQEEVARQAAKAAAAEQARAQLEAKLKQLEGKLQEASCQQTSASDKARLQWYERELSVQTGRAEAALQDKAALEDRIRLLESAQEQQLSRLDEERSAMTHKWQQERSRLQRKLEHWNFEVLAQQREVNRLRQQLQQQGRLTAAGADPTSGGGRTDVHLPRSSAVYTSPPSGSYSRSAAADEPQYIPAYHPTAPGGMAGAPGAPPGQHVQQPVPDACYEASHSHNMPPAQAASCQQYQYGGGVMPPRHGVTAHYEMQSSPAAPGPVLQHHRHGVVLGGAAAEQAMTPRAGGFTPFSNVQQPEERTQPPQPAQYANMQQQGNAGYAETAAYNQPREQPPAELPPSRSPRPPVCTDPAARSIPTNSPIMTEAAAGDSFSAAQSAAAAPRQPGGVSAKHNHELQAFLTAAAAVSDPRETQYAMWSPTPGEPVNADSSSMAPGMLHPPPIPTPQTPRPKVDAGRHSSAQSTPYSVAHMQQEQQQAGQHMPPQNMGPGMGYNQQSSRYACGDEGSSYADSNRSASMQHYMGPYRTRDSLDNSPYPAAQPAQAAAGGSAAMQHGSRAPGALRQQHESYAPAGYVHHHLAGGYTSHKEQYVPY